VTLLVVTAVPAERDALVAGLGDTGVEVVAVGVGGAGAAAGTARRLATGDYQAVLCAGIAGGFDTPLGGTVLGTVSVGADLGAESPDGFVPLSVLGFGPDTHPADPALLDALRQALPGAAVGPILSVNTVTGTAAGAAELCRRYPGAVAEAMEGFGVASAAALAGVPFAELRTISNLVGPRDRRAWRIGDALAALTGAGQALSKSQVLGKLAW
jgi:futalosine hydrolase